METNPKPDDEYELIAKLAQVKMACADNGAVRYSKPAFLNQDFRESAIPTGHLIDCLKVMQPLHRTKMLSIIKSYDEDGYINKTDFLSMIAMFKRYKSEMEETFGHYVADDGTAWMPIFHKQFLYAMELEALTAQAQEMFRKSSTGNFEIRKRNPGVPATT